MRPLWTWSSDLDHNFMCFYAGRGKNDENRGGLPRKSLRENDLAGHRKKSPARRMLTGASSLRLCWPNLIHSVRFVMQITILGELGHIFLIDFRPTVTPQYVRENQARTRPLRSQTGTAVALP